MQLLPNNRVYISILNCFQGFTSEKRKIAFLSLAVTGGYRRKTSWEMGQSRVSSNAFRYNFDDSSLQLLVIVPSCKGRVILPVVYQTDILYMSFQERQLILLAWTDDRGHRQ